MTKINVIFVDDLCENLSMEDFARSLTKAGRYLKVVGYDEVPEMDDLEVLRPIMEMKNWLSETSSLIEEHPGYDEYLFAVLNASPYTKLLHTKEKDRASGARYINRVHNSYRIEVPHYVLAEPQHEDRIAYVHRAASREVYKVFPSVGDLAHALYISGESFQKLSVVFFINGRNLTKI